MHVEERVPDLRLPRRQQVGIRTGGGQGPCRGCRDGVVRVSCQRQHSMRRAAPCTDRTFALVGAEDHVQRRGTVFLHCAKGTEQ